MVSFLTLLHRFFPLKMSSKMCRREKPVIFIAGCTGTGKTDLSVALAERFRGEVINCDSMQIYKGLDIATNKITPEEAREIPHHLFSFVDPSSTSAFEESTGFTVHQYREMALQLIEEIHQRGAIPILVGGTTYYIESVLFDENFITSMPSTSKEEALDEPEINYDQLSNEELHNYLEKIDPNSAMKVHPNNRFRVLRAIEIFHTTGLPKSAHISKQNIQLRYKDSLFFSLDADPEVLDKRLNERVKKMHVNGLRQEVEAFYEQNREVVDSGKYGIMQAIGLKEFVPYLKLKPIERNNTDGDKIFTKCCLEVQLHTRQYSRKQRSWVRNRLIWRKDNREYPSLICIDTSNPSTYIANSINYMSKWLEGKSFTPTTPTTYQVPEDTHEANEVIFCEICNLTIHGRRHYEKHLKGRRHRDLSKRITTSH